MTLPDGCLAMLGDGAPSARSTASTHRAARAGRRRSGRATPSWPASWRPATAARDARGLPALRGGLRGRVDAAPRRGARSTRARSTGCSASRGRELDCRRAWRRPARPGVRLQRGIDKTLAVPNFRLGRRHRAVEQTAMAGGKGVNVARALRALGQPVIATGVARRPDRHPHRRAPHEEGILNDFVRSARSRAPRPRWSIPRAASRPRSTSTART